MNFFSTEARMQPGSPRERRIIIAAALTALALVILDQLTKGLVLKYIKTGGPVTVIPGFFHLQYVTNTGSAWGMFGNYPWVPFSISIVAFILLIVFLRKLSAGWPERCFALLMVASGIVGNCTDRILHGAVIDFLRFHWEDALLGLQNSLGAKSVPDWLPTEWPSFNVADSAICCGVALFVISSFFRPEKKTETKQDEAGNAPKSA